MSFAQLAARFTLTLVACILAVDLAFSALAFFKIWLAKPGYEIVAVPLAAWVTGTAYGTASGAQVSSALSWRAAAVFAAIGFAGLAAHLLIGLKLRGITQPSAPAASMAFLIGLVFAVCLVSARFAFAYGASGASAKGQ